MRVVASLSTAAILQVEKTPDVGDARPFNGKFALPVPEMVPVTVDASSYVQPVDGGDVSSLAFAALLVQFPMYQHVVFNPLMSAADIAALDLTAVFTPTGDITRAFVGRGAGPLPTGNAPNVVGTLHQNGKVGPARPGILISDMIDIGPVTAGVGADEFMVVWFLFDFGTSEDVSSDFGGTAGQNTPAIRSITEIDPEPAGFQVYLSHDDGATYTLMSRLTPTDFVTFNKHLRIAFKNTSSSRRYVASFAILF